MMILAKSLRDISFAGLTEVYRESLETAGIENWPEDSAGSQLRNAEQDFYNYLREVFFRTPGACYAILWEDGAYISALRLEPYLDGLLLSGLETTPDRRQQGMGSTLVRMVRDEFPHVPIYSHVAKDNRASCRLHEACGFRKILDHGVYSDGSVYHSSCTYCSE